MGQSRSSAFWWLYVAILGGAALFIAHTFIAILVLGVAGYYGTRPISNRFETVTESKGLAAGLTALTVLVPVLILTLYAGIRILLQIQRHFDESVFSMLVSRFLGIDVQKGGPATLLSDPPSLGRLADMLSGDALQQGIQLIDLISGTLLMLSLAVTLSYALLVYDEALSNAFGKLVGSREETVFAYARAVDTDLESIFYGNLLFVLFMAVVGTTAYTITNLVAPPGIHIPMAFTLGVLTGLTSLLPIIVSKVVYIPILAYLAVQSGGRHVVFLGALLVAYFLVLDIIPPVVPPPLHLRPEDKLDVPPLRLPSRPHAVRVVRAVPPPHGVHPDAGGGSDHPPRTPSRRPHPPGTLPRCRDRCRRGRDAGRGRRHGFDGDRWNEHDIGLTRPGSAP